MLYQSSLKILSALLAAGLLLSLADHAYALRTDAEQPIHIEGDDAEIDQTNETIVYTGSVEVMQGTLRVLGDRIVVKIKGDQVERIITEGAPAKYKQQLDDDQGEVEAEAKSIIYHTSQERIYLNGAATLTQLGNKLTGESIRYDMVNGRVDASASTDAEPENRGRVQMTLDPASPPPTGD